jgi:type II secretory ATPase GspE/PulE/Tfp pilus assembly ATPase PilB-like protein
VRALQECPKDAHDELVARLKVLAGLRIDEHFLPQDGKFKYICDDSTIDIRLSIAPAIHGENAVLRFLVAESFSLDSLALTNAQRESVLRTLGQAHGMVIVTGPTGSGKTTTLYACMRFLATGTKSMVSIEEPVEYELAEVVQTQVNQQAGYTFSVGLRSLLRQDPDVIMVGEVRDQETASLAAHAALTGHLVLTTLHANDVAGAFPRLQDLGVDPYVIASTVSLVIAQRLVRKRCRACGAHAARPPSHECRTCRGSGFKGRIALYEVFEVTQEFREEFLHRPDRTSLVARIRANGIPSLLEDGYGKAAQGHTSIEELTCLRHA